MQRKQLGWFSFILLVFISTMFFVTRVYASHPFTERDIIDPTRCEHYSLIIQNSVDSYREAKFSFEQALEHERLFAEDLFRSRYGHDTPSYVWEVIEHAVRFIFATHMQDKGAWEVAAAYADECKRWLRRKRV